MNYYIITGASKGLGEAIALQLIQSDSRLFCISRSKSDQIERVAQESEAKVSQIHCDLSDHKVIKGVVSEILSTVDHKKVTGVYLVNNAGVIAPISPIAGCSSDALALNVQVNLIAPMVLVSEFIEGLEALTCEKRIINISSGAGKHPYSGWSAYCASKAGLDLFTQTVGLEEASKDNPVEILSLAPGIVDTPMQGEIRQSSVDEFPDIERFKEFKEKGHLSSPEEVAKQVLTLLHAKDFVQGGVLDVRELD